MSSVEAHRNGAGNNGASPLSGAAASQQQSTAFFKQIDEKQVNQEVSQMLWNPKMDLIALAFTNGDVHLYRMSWQRVWSNAAPQHNLTITAMAWRPDGKVLSVAYSNGHLRLLAVEDAKKIFSFNCNDPIDCLYWVQEDEETSKRHEATNFYEEAAASHTRLLPRPISYEIISQLFEKANIRDFPDNLFIKEIKTLTYLVCTHGTRIAIFVYGYFLLLDANLDLVPSCLNYARLKAAYLSNSASLMSTLGLTEDNLLVYSLLDAKLLHENYVQIKLVSTKFGMLFSMLSVLKGVIKEMEELWEDILVEMDQKFQLYALEKYSNGGAAAAAKPNTTNASSLGAAAAAQIGSSDSSLVNDFMLLYAFGTCSEHFKTFLLQDLTEKGLKKLEVSVENYYANIQRLLNGNFHQLALCMFYHLNELNGMAKWFDKFKIFSITEQQINDVLNNCASLVIKAHELNYVIDMNLKEIKIFFKWLHASILHLSEDQPATDIIRFSEEMENSIVDFIQSTFKDAQTINLEKVGQYLKPDNLKVHITEENSWQNFLKAKLNPKDNQYLYLSKREKSLIGCFEEFKQSLNECFRCQAIKSEQPFAFIKQYNIHKFNSLQDANEMLMSYKCVQNSMITGLLMAKSNNECYILKHPISADPEVKAFIINLSNHTIDLSQVSLQDVYIYGENSVTLLGTDSKSRSNSYLIQLTLQPTPTSVLNDVIEVTSYSSSNDENKQQQQAKEATTTTTTNLLMIKAEKLGADSIVKHIKRMKCASLCASSSRKVCALLAANRHRVRIYELEVDENDEDEAQNNIEDDEENSDENMVEDDAVVTNNSTNDQKHVINQNVGILVNETSSSVTNDESPFNMPSLAFGSANKMPPSFGQFGKQQSAGSTCSIANSVCSSTAATIGSISTIINSSTAATSTGGGTTPSTTPSSLSAAQMLFSSSSSSRNKRKKNFDVDEDDEDDDVEEAASFSGFTADSSSDVLRASGDIEIQANQDGSQNNQNAN